MPVLLIYNEIELQIRKALFFLFCFTMFLVGYSSTAQSFSKLVNTQIGTEGSGLGCGFNFVGAAYPFGMIQFTPSFFTPQKGFVINQLSGAGCPHMGNFPVLPISGELLDSPENMENFDRYKSIHKSHAGYVSLEMSDKTMAKLTVSKRAAIANFVFDKSSEKGTILIGSGVGSTNITNAMVKITSDKTCEGFAEGGDFCGSETNYRIYFVAEFDRPSSEKGTWIKDKILKSSHQAFGSSSGAYFTFDTDKEVNYRIAVSYVSIENAKENLRSNSLEGGFSSYKEKAEKAWDRSLSKISITTSNKERRTQFYTHLYHALIHPNIVSDENGEYMGADFKIHKSKNAEQYSSFSVWDTYRTQAQLLAMLYPDESSDMMQSLVNFAEQSGGFGRWILANIETGIMHGDPTPTLIANSYVFGATNFDLKKAYQFMNSGATIPYSYSQNREIRPYLQQYMSMGFTKASMMLEYTSSDFAIGQFALKALGNKKDAEYFINRSQNWKNIYNSKNKWLNSKDANGNWKDLTKDWNEATHKNYFWMVPHNLKGLIDTIGGSKMAVKRLDKLFERLDAKYDEDWFAAGNEPDFQVPWIYNWTDAPYKTSEVIHRILNEMYTDKATGLPGNEDLGTMGAWYVFASIGLYPMIPGVAGFSVSSPQFDEVSIDFPNGKFIISGGSTETPYIKSLKLNGEKIKTPWIDWKDIKNGGSLKYNTSKKINESWGVNTLSPSYQKLKTITN